MIELQIESSRDKIDKSNVVERERCAERNGAPDKFPKIAAERGLNVHQGSLAGCPLAIDDQLSLSID